MCRQQCARQPGSRCTQSAWCRWPFSPPAAPLTNQGCRTPLLQCILLAHALFFPIHVSDGGGCPTQLLFPVWVTMVMSTLICHCKYVARVWVSRCCMVLLIMPEPFLMWHACYARERTSRASLMTGTVSCKRTVVPLWQTLRTWLTGTSTYASSAGSC